MTFQNLNVGDPIYEWNSSRLNIPNKCDLTIKRYIDNFVIYKWKIYEIREIDDVKYLHTICPFDGVRRQFSIKTNDDREIIENLFFTNLDEIAHRMLDYISIIKQNEKEKYIINHNLDLFQKSAGNIKVLRRLACRLPYIMENITERQQHRFHPFDTNGNLTISLYDYGTRYYLQ